MWNGQDVIMGISRLEKASGALLTTLPSLTQFCDARGIPYTTSFYSTVLPTPALKTQFSRGYAINRLPPTGLHDQGAATAIVFERPSFKDEKGSVVYFPKAGEKVTESFHGEVVATVCQQIGSGLQPGVNTLYVRGSLNPHYRAAFEQELLLPIKDLIENQGIPVIITSMGWDDLLLDFDNGLEDQASHFWRVTAFVVDSAGNDGRYGEKGDVIAAAQKHNIISHAAPLVVRVGAASFDKSGQWVIDGYSSANGPTLLAPVASSAEIIWQKDKPPASVLGTSVAGPYAGGVLTTLNRRYGSYLTREQILYAVIATCKPITHVSAFGKKTPAPIDIAYTKTAAGLDYNPDYGGFGLIDPVRADKLIAHMVDLTQKEQQRVTIPTEERVRLDIRNGARFRRDHDGLYQYEINMPPGFALKTTVEVDFEDSFGKIFVTSPSGTSFAMHLSRSPLEKVSFGISTSHGWAGEPLEGRWIVTSTTPVKRLRLNQHHFLENDIIHSLDIKALEALPWPDLSGAIPLRNFGPDHAVSRILHSKEIRGLSVGGQPPVTGDVDAIIRQLDALPSGFSERRRENRLFTYLIDGTSPAGTLEIQANTAANKSFYGDDGERLQAARFYHQAAIMYGQHDKLGESVNTLSLAAQNYLNCTYMLDERGNLNPEQAIPLLQQAIAASAASEHWYEAYRDNDFLYTALCRTCAFYAETDPDKTAGYASLLASVRQQARHFSFERQGGVDPEAHRIEQGEAGFSNQERIGTDNLSPCIAIIAQDPITLKTGLVHLDNITDISCLDDFFSRMGENRLAIRLVGARFQEETSARQNIMAVMQYLAHVNADLVSADTYGGNGGPSAFVVNPSGFAMEEKVPTFPGGNEALSNAVLLFVPEGKPVITQFDYTVSKDRAPIHLSRKAVQLLRLRYVDQPEWQIEHRLEELQYAGRALAVQSILGLVDAYRGEWNGLSASLEKVIASQPVNADDAEKARKALLDQTFYVGENAAVHNAAIYNWIEMDLFHDGQLQVNALGGINPVHNIYEPLEGNPTLLPTAPSSLPLHVSARYQNVL